VGFDFVVGIGHWLVEVVASGGGAPLRQGVAPPYGAVG